MLCEITIDGKDVQQSGQAAVRPRPASKICPEKLSTDFNFLLESGQFSDVIIKCQGRELSCHKVILGARYNIWMSTDPKLNMKVINKLVVMWFRF